MQRYALPAAVMIALRYSVAYWGVAAFWAWCIACGAGLSLVAGCWGIIVYRLKRGRRKACDDLIHYARKQRAAFGKPAFGECEMQEMQRLRKAGDHASLGKYIAASEIALGAGRDAERRPSEPPGALRAG